MPLIPRRLLQLTGIAMALVAEPVPEELPCGWTGCTWTEHIPALCPTGKRYPRNVCGRCGEMIMWLSYPDGDGHWALDSFVIQEENEI